VGYTAFVAADALFTIFLCLFVSVRTCFVFSAGGVRGRVSRARDRRDDDLSLSRGGSGMGGMDSPFSGPFVRSLARLRFDAHTRQAHTYTHHAHFPPSPVDMPACLPAHMCVVDDDA